MLHSLTGTLPHFLFESCAYLVGARLYWRAAFGQPMPQQRYDRLALLAAAIVGAVLGSKALHIAEHLPALLQANDAALWIAGKSLLGGLIGGTLAVEWMKRRIGWTRPTGDAWVPALAAGIIIGRIGCQLSGLWDLTYGTPTTLPWAWDYGDGIGRHPTALYEAALVAALFVALARWSAAPPGARFAAFLAGYCAIRFGLEFLKPPYGAPEASVLPVARYAGLTAIQWAAIAGGLWYARILSRRLNPMPQPAS